MFTQIRSQFRSTLAKMQTRRKRAASATGESGTPTTRSLQRTAPPNIPAEFVLCPEPPRPTRTCYTLPLGPLLVSLPHVDNIARTI